MLLADAKCPIDNTSTIAVNQLKRMTHRIRLFVF